MIRLRLPRRRRHPLRVDRSGATSVEFILVMPVMIGMTLAIADFGNVLYARFRLDAAVAAGASYGQSRASDVSTTSATDLALKTATLVGDTTLSNFALVTVNVNNGPVGTKNGGNATATTTTPGTTNGLCYCPNSAADFGSQLTCGTICANGGIAGRFVAITARRPYTPLFTNYGIVSDGYISVTSLVQTE